MAITKRCRKMMSFVLAFALILSVMLVISPNSTKAADDDPTVSVLGATLRFGSSDNNGSQSMRIGIQIGNANKAKACAITLTVGSKTYKITTEEIASGEGIQQTKLHSKDSANNSVIYAVVLTNIPRASFSTPIGIVGSVKGLDDVEHSTSSTSRNITALVTALQSQYSGLHIMIGEDGNLYKKVDNATSKLTLSDLENYSDSDPAPDVPANPAPTLRPDASGSVDFTTGLQGNTEYTSVVDGKLVVNDTRDGDGTTEFYIPLTGNQVISAGEKVVIAMEGECASTCQGFRVWIGTGVDTGCLAPITCDYGEGEFSKQLEFTAGNECTFITFKSKAWNGPRIKGLTLSSVKIYYPDRGAVVPQLVPPSYVNLSRAVVDDGENVVVRDGILYYDDTKSDGTSFVGLPLADPVNGGEHVTVVVEGWFDSTAGGFRMYLANGWTSGSNIQVVSASEGYFRKVLEYTANSGGPWQELRFRGGNGVPGRIRGLEVDSVRIYYTDRGAVVPAAGPTPTPRATPTPVPTPGEDMSRSFDLSQHTGDDIVTDNADGSITINDPRGSSTASVVYFRLPGEVVPNETVTLIIKGSSTGDCTRFRAWLGNGPNSYSASIPNIDTPEGNFSARITIKANQTSEFLTFKSSSYNGPAIQGITITEATIYYTDRGAVVPE